MRSEKTQIQIKEKLTGYATLILRLFQIKITRHLFKNTITIRGLSEKKKYFKLIRNFRLNYIT